MRYEKKTLILSGKGKGVVVIERSGAGVKFTLNAFELMQSVFKAGIVTPRSVIIRDLPPVKGSTLSAVFIVPDLELDRLHFALFDTEIQLYGATCERMWESNLTDILMRRDRLTSPTPLPLPLVPSENAEYTRLPPPETVAYLDEALPRDNFYTALDYSKRMSEVDAFLDAPRAVTGSILDGLAPTVTPHSETTAALDAQASSEHAETERDGQEPAAQSVAEIESETESEIESATTEQAEAAVQHELDEAASEKETTGERRDNDASVELNDRTGPSADNAGAEISQAQKAYSEAAAAKTAVSSAADFDSEPRSLPWELESRFLSSRGGRKPVRRVQKVEPVRQSSQVKKLRDMLFFERTRADIDKLFSVAPKDENLCKLLSDVEWVRVELSGGSVSVGRGGDSFLCYAVGGTYAHNPFGEEAQWLPVKADQPTERGYWLVFQSLATGDIIRTE